MSIDTSVKFFHSGMTGAPQLTATAGSLLTILRACLVSGFGAVAVDSIAVASGVATLTISAGMPFNEVDSVILVSGCALAALNGEKKIAALGTTTLTFDASGLSDGSYSGGISAKIAPAGWAELFTGTNVAVFQSLSPQSTKCCLRVDDTGTTDARVVGYEAMSDLNTGLGRVPLDSQISGGGYWPKADSINNPAREWAIFSDARMMYIWTSPFDHRSYQQRKITGHVFCFGDLIPHVQNNPYAWCISAGNVPDTSFGAYVCSTSWLCSADGHYTPRNASGGGASSQLIRNARTKGNGLSKPRFAGVEGFAYPSPSMSALLVTDLWADTYTDNDPMGFFPGIKIPMQAIGGTFGFSHQHVRVDQRTLMSIYTSQYYDQSNGGNVFFDITGPWR